jgi:hypothetical protein
VGQCHRSVVGFTLHGWIGLHLPLVVERLGDLAEGLGESSPRIEIRTVVGLEDASQWYARNLDVRLLHDGGARYRLSA